MFNVERVARREPGLYCDMSSFPETKAERLMFGDPAMFLWFHRSGRISPTAEILPVQFCRYFLMVWIKLVVTYNHQILESLRLLFSSVSCGSGCFTGSDLKGCFSNQNFSQLFRLIEI